MSACGYCAVYAGRGVSPCPLCGGTEGLRLVPRDAPAWPAIRSGASLGAAGPLPVTGSDKGPAPITPGPQYPVGATAAEAHQALLQAGAKNGGCLPAAGQGRGRAPAYADRQGEQAVPLSACAADLLPGGAVASPAGPSPAGEAFYRDAFVSAALPPAVALVWRMVRAHDAALTAGESLARAICAYARELGVPALAREGTVEFCDVPGAARRGRSRFADPRAPP